jgi:uncharacterized protein (TIGR00369 family)
MKRLNPDYAREVMAVANRSPYFSLLSMRIVRLEIRGSLIEIELKGKHLQPFGYVHGGVFSSMIDTATWWAAFPELDQDMGMTTVDLKVNNLAPARTGKMTARGRSIKMGRTLGLADAEVVDESGRLLAHGTSTLMLIPGHGLEGLRGLPPKFIG